MSDFLKDKTAIITGGSGTIGKAIAKCLLIAGCNVFITGRNQTSLDKAAADLTSDDANHGEVQTFSGDVCSEKDISDLFDAAINAYGGVDLLVNNAGTAIPGKTTELSVEDFEKVMQVNVTGPFICAREAIRRMRARDKGGRIVNIGSISAFSPRPDGAPYTASKFALLGLSNSLSLDCRQYGIAVGIIHPGNVMSGLLTQEIIAEREKSEGFMNAEDVASCVLAMSSLEYRANILEMTVMPTKQPLIGRG
jgi:NAD(P)-dependent dehydrogenase (short-subunit alcohol dehydrogenase family)